MNAKDIIRSPAGEAAFTDHIFNEVLYVPYTVRLQGSEERLTDLVDLPAFKPGKLAGQAIVGDPERVFLHWGHEFLDYNNRLRATQMSLLCLVLGVVDDRTSAFRIKLMPNDDDMMYYVIPPVSATIKAVYTLNAEREKVKAWVPNALHAIAKATHFSLPVINIALLNLCYRVNEAFPYAVIVAEDQGMDVRLADMIAERVSLMMTALPLNVLADGIETQGEAQGGRRKGGSGGRGPERKARPRPSLRRRSKAPHP